MQYCIRILAAWCIGISTSYAFPCYATLVKDTCWTQYDVTVTVLDAMTHKALAVIDAPKGQSWGREPFTCQPGQQLLYTAQFKPTFWQGDENKTYTATSYWSLPKSTSPKESAWNVSICYARDFSEVPMPPGATASCQCQFQKVPPIPSVVVKP